jgi:hypothetical protein
VDHLQCRLIDVAIACLRIGFVVALRFLLAAALLAAFLLVPPYLKASVGPPRAFTLQEAADLLTPLVIVPLAWIVFDLAGGLGRRGMVAFLVVAALWVEGQGIHLAANAIGDAFPHAATEAFYQTAPGELDLWLDETLSHWMWHVAWVAFAILMLALLPSAVGCAQSSIAPIPSLSNPACPGNNDEDILPEPLEHGAQLIMDQFGFPYPDPSLHPLDLERFKKARCSVARYFEGDNSYNPERLIDDVAGRLKALCGQDRTLIVLIHGFNATMPETSRAYTVAQLRIEHRFPRRKFAYL